MNLLFNIQCKFNQLKVFKTAEKLEVTDYIDVFKSLCEAVRLVSSANNLKKR